MVVVVDSRQNGGERVEEKSVMIFLSPLLFLCWQSQNGFALLYPLLALPSLKLSLHGCMLVFPFSFLKDFLVS